MTDWRIEQHESLPSTHLEVVGRAIEGAADGLAVLAARQTAGRGRDGRVWQSPPGNLYLSVLLRPAAPARHAPQYGLMAAVALHAALAAALPDAGALRLKWPNDVLLGGAKIAGLLVESAADAAGQIDWLTVGIGANLAVAPQLPGRATVCLGPDAPRPAVFAEALLAQLAAWRGILESQGFAAIRAAWMARGPGLGETLALREGPEGLYRGLSEAGALLLETEGRVLARHSGEVV